MRRLSPYVTRLLLTTRLTANAVTAVMIPTGLLAALLVSLGGLLPAGGAVLLAQLQLLLDCCDGELARWRRTSSAVGVYLDQIAHYSTEAALPAALGVRADGGWDSIGGWTALGLAVSVLILLLKAETHLVGFARARVADASAPSTTRGRASEPAGGRIGPLRMRDGGRHFPFFRPFLAVEATLLALAAALADAATDDLDGSRGLLLFLVGGAILAVCGHLAAVLTSDRLK
jgi:phosphatidylglycerophosphate synthase